MQCQIGAVEGAINWRQVERRGFDSLFIAPEEGRGQGRNPLTETKEPGQPPSILSRSVRKNLNPGRFLKPSSCVQIVAPYSSAAATIILSDIGRPCCRLIATAASAHGGTGSASTRRRRLNVRASLHRESRFLPHATTSLKSAGRHWGDTEGQVPSIPVDAGGRFLPVFFAVINASASSSIC